MNVEVESTDVAIASTSLEKPDSKLGFCEVCAIREAKYTCPRCDVKTCSLGCNKIHKLEVECNGQRDKTKFIAINKFTNLDLSSDYRLLEEISRVVEASKKGRRNFSSRFNLEKRALKLQKEALKRKTCIKFLPKNFARHKCNTSRFNFVEKIIQWHIEWIFVNCENMKISDNLVSENERISTLVNNFLMPEKKPELQEKLQFYQAAGLPGIKILLKAEQKAGKKFYELDPTFTLKDSLKNKLLIEYPTIHLVLRDQASFYDIIDSDDEDDRNEFQQLKSGHEVINNIIKKAESDESLYESLKNFLFISEYSDDEQVANESD